MLWQVHYLPVVAAATAMHNTDFLLAATEKSSLH